jgi:hypothetical protein
MFYKIVESISKLFTKSISIESETDSVELTVPEERTLLIDSNIISGNLLKFNDLDITNNIYVGNDAIVSGTLIAGEGYISGGLTVGNYLQLLPVELVNIPANTTASYIYTSGSTNDLYFTQYGGDTNNVIRLRWLESLLTTGILHGGILSTVNGTTTFSIADGSAIIVEYNADTDQEPYPEVKYINWNNFVSQSLIYSASNQITYIAIDNSGSIVQSPTAFTINDYDDKIILGRVLHQSGAVSNGTITSPRTAYGVGKKSSDFIKALGPVKVSGHVLEHSGSTLGLIKSAGTSFVEGRNYTNVPDDPDVVIPADDLALVNSKIFREYVSGSVPNIDTGIANAGYAVIDPTKYNNNGTLANVTANKWSLQRVYWFPRSVNRALFVYYGNAIYNSQSEAVSAIISEAFIEGENTIGAAIFVGTIVVRGGASNLGDIGDAKIIQAGIFGSSGGSGAGTITVPGDGDKSIQFNDGGSVFGGSANFTFDKTTNVMTLTGSISGTTGLFTTVSGSTVTGSTALFTTITGSTVTGSTARFTTITASAGINITNGNLIFGTSGKGIDFSITSNAITGSSGSLTSEVFSDYEEGSWTPQLSSSDSSFPNQAVVGTYRKIGTQLIASFRITLSSSGNTFGPAASLQVIGLPFVSAAAPSASYASCLYVSAFSTLGSASSNHIALMTENDSAATLYKKNLNAGTVQAMRGSDLTGSCLLVSTLSYITTN